MIQEATIRNDLNRAMAQDMRGEKREPKEEQLPISREVVNDPSLTL